MSLSKPEFTCEECWITCSYRSSLNKHKIFHESPQYQCIQCDKHFHTKWHLKRHVITHTGDSNHVCDLCGTRFVCGFNLKRHTKSVHMEEKNHKCDICNKHFRRAEYLDAHALKHLNAHRISEPSLSTKCKNGSLMAAQTLTIITHITSIFI